MSESLQLTVPLSRLRKMVDALKDKPDITPLSFEFILLAFFPTAWRASKKLFMITTQKAIQPDQQSKKNETEIST